MKGKKFLAGVLSAAMVLGSMALPAFAHEAQAPAASDENAILCEFAEAPDMTGTIIDVTVDNAQDVLDGKYGNIDGKTIQLAAGDYGMLYLRQSLYEGASVSRTDLENDHNSYPAYYREFNNVTIKAAEGANVTCDGFKAEAGLFWYNSAPASNQEAMNRATSGFISYMSLKNITIEGIAFDNTEESAVVIRDNSGSQYKGSALYVDGFTVKDCKGTGTTGNLYQHFFSAGTGSSDLTFCGTENGIKGLNNLAVIGCEMTNYYQPVFFNNASAILNGLTVSDNTFTGCVNNIIMLSNKENHGIFVFSNNTLVNTDGRFIRMANAQSDAVVTFAETTISNPVAYDEDGTAFKVTGVEGFSVAFNNNGSWHAMKSNDTTYSVYKNLADALKDAKSGDTITLLEDVQLTDEWTPIDNFAGTFDGNGKTISGLKITAAHTREYVNNGNKKTESATGLFANLPSTAVVKNLTIDGAEIRFSENNTQVGVLAGYLYGATVENVKVTNAIVDIADVQYVGGLCGKLHGTVKNCTVSDSTITGKDQVGGLVGYSWIGKMDNCKSISNTIRATEERAGGLIGKMSATAGDLGSGSVYVTNCTVSGGSAAAPYYAGGLIAQFMGNCDKYSITGNTVDKITLTAPKTSAFATLRKGQNDTFLNALSTKVAHNSFDVAKVVSTAKSASAKVTLNDLHNNEAINLEEDATYKVVVAAATAADIQAAVEAIEKDSGTDVSKQIFDISVVKIDSEGTEIKLDGTGSDSVKNQSVTITLGETPARDSVRVYHVGDTTEEITGVTVDGDKITFTAPSFSTYAVSYNAESLEADDISKNIGVAFERIGTTSTYDIVLKSLDSKKINRFMSAELTFDMNIVSGAVGYTVAPAANINLIEENGRFEFNLDGKTASSATGTDINIGTVTFDGAGEIEFSVADAVTNIINCAKAQDNIVDSYTVNGDGSTAGKLSINDDVTNSEGAIIGKIGAAFVPETEDLTINIDFPNEVKDNAAAYQDMKVIISGGGLTENLVYNLGSDKIAMDADGKYVIKVIDTLTKNAAYKVQLEGAGYRTARYTVNMTGAKTINFWNNVKDSKVNVEIGNDASAKNVTFLAGDIVKDNQINIYDLSAVVSYFGTDNLVTDHPEYAKYDLNRDGKIDSKDIAYVLISWGK